MALAILAVTEFDLADHGVAVTGDVPTGLFSIGFPGIGGSDTGALSGGGARGRVRRLFGVAGSGALDGPQAPLRDRRQPGVDCAGLSSGAAGLVGGFPVDGSLSKTSVADSAGQKLEMASLINAVFILLTLLFLASLFEDLPTQRSARSSSTRWSG